MADRDPLGRVVIDAGNTKIRLAAWRGGEQVPGLAPDGCFVVPAPLIDLGTVPTPEAGAEGDPAAAVAAALENYAGWPRVLTSVAPTVTAALVAVEPPAEVVAHTWRLPFRLEVDDPHTVGADRLCNVAAAAAAGAERALIVDAGTATTFDLLLEGRFVGGLIAPGMALAAACLGRRAAQLNPVPFAPAPLRPGRTTAAAMAAGAFQVGTRGVDAVIDALVARHDGLSVVLTGGLGHHLVGSERPWDPFWTLRGAALLADMQPNP